MQILWQDMRFALRMLRKNAGFAAIAIVTLALGIGANTAIFSTVYAVLLRPLPYRDPNRLLSISAADPQSRDTGIPVSFTKFTQLEQQSRTLESVAAYFPTTLSLTTAREPEAVNAARVSVNFFATLGISPARGRNFSPEEQVPGSGNVVLISDTFWHSHFGADENVIGKALDLDGKATAVIGVLPSTFRFSLQSAEPDAWLPRVMEHPLLKPAQVQIGAGYLSLIGRMRAGETLPHLQAELETISEQYKQQFGSLVDAPRYGLAAVDLEKSLVGDLHTPFLVLSTAVGLLLLIACANVANLLLARATTRNKELAVRKVLGASRIRLVRQLVSESLLLSSIGGILGVALAFAVMPLIRSVGSDRIPRLAESQVNGTVLLFSLALTGLTGLLFGVAPAFQIAGKRMEEHLRESTRGASVGVGRTKSRAILIIGEVAIALVLITGAALFVESFVRLMRVDPGFTAQQLMTFPIRLPATRYPQPDRQALFFRQLLEQVRAMPQVQAAGVVSFLPLSGGARLSYFCVEGQVCQGAGKDPLIAFWQVSEGYFDAVKTPLLEGRLFNANDKAGGLSVTIVNQTAAKHFWPNQNPLGKHIVGSRDNIAREVVGVVADMKFTALNSASVEQLYVPVEQMPYPSMTLLVRSSANPSILVPAVRAKIAELDRNLPISNISSMENIVKDSVAQPRMITRFVSLFAAFAMLLATIGIYGVMAYSVAMRTREMGIRMSLGASKRDILKLVIGQGMQLAGIGLVIGVLLSLVAGRLVSSLLFGIHATDPTAFGTAAGVLMLTSLCACYAPARRAIRVNPIVALREE